MSFATLEKDGWNRIYFYSSLFDTDSWDGDKRKTSRQKFIHQGKIALRTLLRLHYLSLEEAEWASKNVIEHISPGTMNGAALALVCTTFDVKAHKFLVQPDASSKGAYREYQKKKCWKTLVETLSNEKSNLKTFVDEYGITGPDLLRYFLYLRKGEWETESVSFQEEEDDE